MPYVSRLEIRLTDGPSRVEDPPYLSAVSLMYAATGDARFKERADYMVGEMKVVQDAHGDGYVGAIKGGKEMFQEVANGTIRSGGFDLNGQWAPWYTLHKTFAGLRDAYRHAGNPTALDVEKKFAAWAESIVSKLSEEQMQRMLNTVLGSIDPESGATCYMVPVGRSQRGREYAQMLPSERGGGSFTCCVGSGMESHALHGSGIYYESGDRFWVNLYAPSIAEWGSAGVKVDAQTDFPEGEAATFVFTTKSPKAFTLALRRPAWAGERFAVKVNGAAFKDVPKPASYVIDGQKLADVAFEPNSEPVFDDVEYKVPAEMVRGKEKVTVRFQGTGAGDVGPVFGVRMIRADAPK